MKPEYIKTKILLDSGDPQETKQALELLGFLDGQTTNPSLIAKNPNAQERLAQGNKFTREEVNDFYKNVVTEIRSTLQTGSISIEVYADQNTTAQEMLNDAYEMYTWIPEAHIKLPTTLEGLKAARELTDKNIPVNMTLVFSQEQAAAVYSATSGAQHDVFVSPFIGRLDDINVNGISLVENIQKMFEISDHHTKVLSASIRNVADLEYILAQNIDMITVPFKILKEWAEKGMNIDEQTHEYINSKKKLEIIEHKDLDLNQTFDTFNIQHDLTDKGLVKFAKDWNNLIV